MINLAVINLKDLIKYLVKIIIIVLTLWFIKDSLSNIKIIKFSSTNIIDYTKFKIILDENIPGIYQINKISNDRNIIKDNNADLSKFKPLQAILQTQLGILNSSKQITEQIKEENIEESANAEIIEKAKTELNTQIIENNVPNKFTNIYHNVQIKNGTDYNLTDEILEPYINLNNKNIIIFHTHTCESYTPTQKFNYSQTGTFRTTDLSYSVAKVGDELTTQLSGYGYNVIHDKTYHDYPAYSGSYERSIDTVKKLLANNQDTDIIIDIHRDAIADYSYAPTVKIGEDYASQLMFVIGTDGGGLEHPKWQQNLKFAIKIQEKANELYPGLFKPIILRNSRYNQHLAKAACIIEVGATGNTLEQSITSMKYLAKVISEVIK